jgi:hypothetical protein
MPSSGGAALNRRGISDLLSDATHGFTANDPNHCVVPPGLGINMAIVPSIAMLGYPYYGPPGLQLSEA